MKPGASLPVIVISIITFVAATHLSFFHLYTKRTLNRDLEEQMLSIADQITNAIDAADFGSFASSASALETFVHNHPLLLEIAVHQDASHPPAAFGTNRYADAGLDARFVAKALEKGTGQGFTSEVGGRKVYRSYIPVTDADRPYVIAIVADYEAMQTRLERQLRDLILTFAVLSPLTVALAFVCVRWIRSRNERAVQAAQETFIGNVQDLFASIRAQRHDFLNQVQTIHTMAAMGKTEDLKRFTRELLEDIQEINDIIRIGNPAVASLVQAKVASALDKKIDFEYEVDDLQCLELGVRSVDIVKIIGNLVDNAFDEVADLPESRRYVHLAVFRADGTLHIKTENPGRCPEDDEIRRWFEPGYSSRLEDGHYGLGLAIAKECTERYKGTIEASYRPEEGIIVHVKIPLEYP